MSQKTDQAQLEFWTEYEKQHGEKVLAHFLGRYLSGWPEHPYPLWGLLIATDGGFRFHHFPHEGWLQALSRVTTGGTPPQEKTIFVPRNRIRSAELRVENRWWKKIIAPCPPLLVIQYHAGNPDTDPPRELLVETDKEAKILVPLLNQP
jgi:hypothetical protein